MTIWSPTQLRAFLDSVRGDRLYAAWLLAATTGMRRGEVLGVRWSDVDLEAGTLTVAQIRTVVAYEVVTLTPKTDKGRRTISLDPQTVAALRAHRVAQNEERLLLGPAYVNTDLVFTRPDGSGIHPERLSRWFTQRCRKAAFRSCAFTTSGTRTSRRCSPPACRSKSSANASVTPHRW